MCGIGDETLVAGIALVKPRQRVIDRGHERYDLQRNSLHRQARAALMDVDATRLVRGRIKPSEGAPHDHRCRDEGRGSHQKEAWQGDAEERKRCHDQRLGAGQPALCRRDDLHIAGLGVDPLQPRRRLARIVLEQLPAEPRLADLVEAAADRSEFGRHGTFGERMSLPVADQEPEVWCLGTQLFELGRRPHGQAALCVARQCVLHDVDHAILVALGEHKS